MKRLAITLRRLADRLDPPEPPATYESSVVIHWPKGTTFSESLTTGGPITFR